MNPWHDVSIGADPQRIFNCVIEVPRGAKTKYELDKTTGLVRWRLPIEAAGGIVADGDRLYVAAAEKGIYALDRWGHVVWRQGTRGGGEPARPLVVGDYLVYTLSEDGVYIANKQWYL